MDLMLLVAATAAGFAMQNACMDDWAGLGRFPFHHQTDVWFVRALSWGTSWIPLWLAPWTVTFTAIGLRHPRPDRRHLARQTGAVALAAATGVLAVGSASILTILMIRYLPEWRPSFWIAFATPLFCHCALDLRLHTLAGGAVATSWAILALTGRWRPNQGWIDLAGRFLGLCWIGIFLIDICLGPWIFLTDHFQTPPPALRTWSGDL